MREIPMPKFHEALMDKDEEYRLEFEGMAKRAGNNPWINQFCRLGMKEGIFSDMADRKSVV